MAMQRHIFCPRILKTWGNDFITLIPLILQLFDVCIPKRFPWTVIDFFYHLSLKDFKCMLVVSLETKFVSLKPLIFSCLYLILSCLSLLLKFYKLHYLISNFLCTWHHSNKWPVTKRASTFKLMESRPNQGDINLTKNSDCAKKLIFSKILA